MLCDFNNSNMLPKNSGLVLLVLFVVVSSVYSSVDEECLSNGNCTQHTRIQNGSDTVRTPYIQEVTAHTAKPVEKPKILSMLADDQMSGFQHEIVTSTTTVPTNIILPNVVSDSKEGRALDFKIGDHNNGLNNTGSSSKEDLSDVSMDTEDEDDEIPMTAAKILAAKHSERNNTLGTCEKGGLTYENGEKLEIDCDTICTCTNGKMDCEDRCREPFIRKGKRVKDPFCKEKSTDDPCCSVLQCTADTETEPLEICSYKNKTYNRGDIIKEGCQEVCSCEAAGRLACKPRCSPITKPSDKCLEIPDMNDPCCKTVICDVTLKDNKLTSAKYVNSTTIKLEFDTKIDQNQTLPLIDISEDKSKWKTYTPMPGGFLSHLEGNFKYAKIENTDDVIDILNIEEGTKISKGKFVGKGCLYKDKEYKINEEFYDSCDLFCVCKESGPKCLKFECPTYFGTDVIDPNCIEWETVPANFTPTPPRCCPEKLHCKYNGSCEYKGETYQNWQQIPSNVTGCEKRCYCEMGKVECQNICPPVTALPPANLDCPPQHARLSHLAGDDCCVYWMCNEKDDVNGTEQTNEPVLIQATTDRPYLAPFLPIPTKAPSKTLGPLLVYINNKTTDDQTKTNEKPPVIVLPEENPYFNKKDSVDNKNKNKNKNANKDNKQEDKIHFADKDVDKDKTAEKNKTVEADEEKQDRFKNPNNKNKEDKYPTKDSEEEYLGPLNPSFKPPQKPKPGKDKAKPNKNIFVTPPSIHNYNDDTKDFNHFDHMMNKNPNNFDIIEHPNKHDFGGSDDYEESDQYNYGGTGPINPNNIYGNANKNFNNPDKNKQIRIHGKGSPEEILHIINQHPEIADYPPGSVLEIHNIPQHGNQDDANSIHHPQNPPPSRVPNPNQDSNPNKSVLPSGLTLEQILQEIHKTGHPNSNNLIPFQNSQNGQFFIPPNRQQFGNGRPQHNVSGLGHPGIYPVGFPGLPGYQLPMSHEDINVHILEALDAHTIRLAFTVPPVIVGLHGRVEVRYTHKNDEDPNSWELQVFAPPNDLIATPQLEFDLVDLRPDTEYKIKITVTLRDLHNTPTSRVYSIRTLKAPPSSTLPPMIPIEPDLVITDVNATWANVAWRKFTDYELQFIDGVQLRFKEIEGKIYAATPLIHRAVTGYTLENLKPNSKYEIGIFFIPFPGQHTELHSENMLHFTTANEIDTYGFNVTLDITLIKATNVEISWSGVPYPEDKYVNIYRAIYQSDSGKGDSSTFKVAKRDSPSKSSITDLKPGTRYRLWLEIYLTNGKIKTSNVQDFITKPRSPPHLGASSKQDKLSGEVPEEKNDYYGPLVIVAILAAIAILSTLVLLLILVRRQNQNKACITPPPRVSQSAYDNPTYKVEIQQETMDL